MGDKNEITNLLNHLFTISYSINFFPASKTNLAMCPVSAWPSGIDPTGLSFVFISEIAYLRLIKQLDA